MSDDLLKPTLFELPPLEKPTYQDGMTNREKWWQFHIANLHVYEILRSMALDLKAKGFRKCGISLLWERLRWESYIQTNGLDEYKLSNNHRAYYSRFLMAREPELLGFFNIKSQSSEEPIEPEAIEEPETE